MALHSIEFSNLAEFDALAQSVAARLNCETSLISVVHDDAFFALGHSKRTVQTADRSVPISDAVCAHTMESGKPLRVADIRADPVLSGTPTVQALDIGAYLGVPLRLENGTVVGALCAISKESRIWQEAEQTYLEALADLVESKIERHVLRYEQKALSAALAENDAILTTLAELRGQAMTVHNDAGELVFANSALRTDLHLSYQELLALPKAAQQLAEKGRDTGEIVLDLPGRDVNALHVNLSRVENGLTLAEWRRV